MILYLNAEVGGLSIQLKIKRLKIKKKRKIDQNKNNKRKQKTTTTKLNIIAKLGFEPRSLAWKASVIGTGVLYHMDS